jgi:hypothetical protein
MPPLAILLVSFSTLLILARTCLPTRCQLYVESEFITDLLHGICPQCGMKAHLDDID